MTRWCHDPERERNHVLGTQAASCHTCAMDSTLGWKVGDRCYVQTADGKLLGTIDSIDASRGFAYVNVTLNGNTGRLHYHLRDLIGEDLP